MLAALPFLAAGIVIALAVRGYARSIGRVYAFDLAGAGIGAAAVVPLMWVFDATTLLVALGGWPRWPPLLFAPAASRRSAALAGGARRSRCCSSLLAGRPTAYYLDPRRPRARCRALDAARARARLPAGPRGATATWSTTATSARSSPTRAASRCRTGGRSRRAPEHRLRAHRPGRRARDRRRRRARHPHRAHLRAAARGRDRAQPRRSATWSTRTCARSPGGPYSLPRVHTTIGDGRSAVAESDKRYDQIQIGYVDTFSADRRQAFALTEHNLYTVEAFEEFFDHLKPGGVLNLARPVEHNGEEALRATVLTLEALEQERRGEPGAQRRGDPRPTTSRRSRLRVRHDPRQARAVHAGRARARSGGWRRARATGIAYAPGGPVPARVGRAGGGAEPDRVLRGLPARRRARRPTTSRSSST